EAVALGGRVLLNELGELVDERGTEARHPLVVGWRETYDETVRREDAIARDDGRLRVELAAQGRGHLERLQTALEGLGERAVDDTLQALLEFVENPQGSPLGGADAPSGSLGLSDGSRLARVRGQPRGSAVSSGRRMRRSRRARCSPAARARPGAARVPRGCRESCELVASRA